MAAIEMRLAPMMQEMSTGSKGIAEQAGNSLSFVDLLASLQALLTPATSTESVSLPEQLDENRDILELPEWSEDQLEDIQSLLGNVLQAISALPLSLLSDSMKEEANQLAKQMSLLSENQDIKGKSSLGDPFSIVSEAIALVDKIKTSGIPLGKEVNDQLRQLVEALQNPQQQKQSTIEQKKSDTQQLGQQQPFLLPLSSAGLIHKAFTQNQAVTDTLSQVGEMKPDSVPLSSLSFLSSGTTLQQLTESGNGGPSLVHQERFVSDMTDFLMSKIRITHQPGLTEAKVSLYPEHLGQLDVKISLQQGQLVAQFLADSTGGRDLLEANLPALRAALQQQGIQVDKLDVYHMGDASLMNQQQRDRSGTFQQNQQRKQEPITDIRLEGEESTLPELERGSFYGSGSLSEKNIDFTA